MNIESGNQSPRTEECKADNHTRQSQFQSGHMRFRILEAQQLIEKDDLSEIRAEERSADANQAENEHTNRELERSGIDCCTDFVVRGNDPCGGPTVQERHQLKGFDGNRDHRFVGFQSVIVFEACTHNTPVF
ncbi:hypothetical protein J8I87_06200 [Paraburkholderia sp. LEh10]|uniref:hypothetical protein n=1 Tax=Paraburkholderia sp. LEh10 TaxID=2821353 RepID=UPI001AE3A9BA|nr:hypothetical protein [Paraburkholderia sp. LEh10]MBP0589316.1 hypothetical protein [Paraburkholderia sp. LEh10]